MAKKDIDELKKLLKTGKLIIGTKKVVKSLRSGSLIKVFLSSNCPSDVEEDVFCYAKLGKVKVVKLGLPNDELGILCKKQFSISVLGTIK